MLLKKTSKLYHYVRCIPKTLFFNFYYLPFKKAIKLPILVNHRTKFIELSGKLSIPDNAKFGKIKLGFGRVQIADNKYSRLLWNMNQNSKLHLGNNIKIGTGCKLHNSGVLTIGSGCNFSGEATIICNTSITFGAQCLVSWQTLFMDSDLHQIVDSKGVRTNHDKPIVIEDNVWVGARSSIVKGVTISHNSIVASGSNVTRSFPANSVIGGNPASIIGDMQEREFIH